MVIGCEPASASTLAGVRKMVADGTISEDNKVVCILTGHLLKDTDIVLKSAQNAAHEVE